MKSDRIEAEREIDGRWMGNMENSDGQIAPR